ncbi:hypothetical protein Ahy_B05g076117 [Arachis hypogaea]|uniref:Ubiquitin-like protease family profile domain-containing protein n=1 Tax=Arachis hypogaea TaxID=3818 RepID=A0A444Z2L5_ARAHY|nr:hypothetical protein Ahy_B05g076117 [Arachis hypogaea]
MWTTSTQLFGYQYPSLMMTNQQQTHRRGQPAATIETRRVPANKTAAEVVAHKETKLISTQGKHFTRSVGPSQNTRGSLYGYPTMMPKNNYGRTSANLIRTRSIGGNSKFLGLGPADPIHGFPVNPPLVGHLNGPRPRPSTFVRLFGSLMNTMCLDAFSGVPADKRLLKPTDNKLTDLQRAVAAYAFNPMGDPMEELVRFGHFVLQRHNILTLQPPHMPDDNIFEMLALWLSLATRENDRVEFWTLPPGFTSAEELASRYKERWMRHFNSLNYVYIPVKDACRHWYLAVVAFRERTLYHLDASMDEEGSVSRKLFVRNLGEALSQLVAIGEYSPPLAKNDAEITCFSIASANGLPVGQPREACAIWVLSWMAMAGAFQHNMLPSMDDKVVRIHTALTLLMSPANEAAEWITTCDTNAETCVRPYKAHRKPDSGRPRLKLTVK